MRAIILSIGDELTLGQTLDTNSQWLAQQLAAVGYRPVAHVTVPDDQAAIEQAFEEAVGRCDVLVVSGGLGPTEDDVTRQALAAFLGTDLDLVPAALENVERFFRQLRRPMPERNKIQAMLPRGCEMIENTAGTAPGIYCNYQSGDQKTLCAIFIVPGVPKEMRIMFERGVRPRLMGGDDGTAGGNVILSKTLHTFGVGESLVAERLGELMRRDRNPSVGTTVSNGYVSLRINAYFPTLAEAAQRLAVAEAACRDALGDLIWGQEDETLPALVGQMLKASGGNVTTAESCTGGLLSAYITDVPGSSAYFSQGFVTYSNEAKTQMLGVPAALIERHGAVSEEVVAAMAAGAQARAKATYALAISGIAGPDGGTAEKPVGTVCLALAGGAGEVETRRFIFHGDREMIRDRSAKMGLTMLRFALMGKKLPF